MTRKSGRRRTGAFVALVVGVIVVLFLLGYRAYRKNTMAGKSSANLILQPLPDTTELTGTWQDANGNVWNMRSDGTGRQRTTGRRRTRIAYFKWRYEPQSQKLTLVETSNNILALARDTVIGENSSDFMIAKTLKDEFDIVDPGTGRTCKFVRTSDSEVEDAP